MLRNVSPLLVPVAALAIGGLLACDNGPSTSPGLGTPTTPGTPLTRLEISGPISVAPGATVQLTATAHRADGSSQDVTADALWSSSNTRVLSVSAGRATGHQIGESMVSANFGEGRGTRETIVVPLDTFRIVGVVTENEPPLSPVGGATVSTSGAPGNDVSTTTGEDGRFKLYGVAGDVELRITKSGYHPYVQPYRAVEHAMVNAQLRLLKPRSDLSGTYALTVAAADDCSFALSEAVRVRNYTAIVTMTGNQIDVRLEGARFAISGAGMGNRFRGLSEGSELVFTLTPYDANGYFYYKQFYGDLVEQLPDSTYLIVSGRVTAVESTSGFAGTLNGAMTVYSGPLDFYPKTVVECRSNNHRITFRR